MSDNPQYLLGLDPASPPGAPPVRRLVLASAGSGKTHQLTSRLIELLARGVPSEEILASTFTRKAAGEITDRLLLRLARGARDEVGAEALRASLQDPGATGRDVEEWGALLLRLCQRLNRLQVHTLDAFFHRIAASFALEMGLPLRWRVASDPERNAMLAEAVEASIGEADLPSTSRLVRQIAYGRTDQGVHALLLGGARDLRETYVSLDPAEANPWGFGGGTAAFSPVAPDVVARAIGALEQAPLPTTKDGSQDSRWVQARDQIVGAARSGEWGEVVKGFARAIAEEKPTFYGKEIPAEVREAVDPLLVTARNALGRQYQERVEALGRFLPAFDAHVRAIQRERGLYGFADLTYAVMRAASGTTPREIFYRLDAHVHHLLLDEFQDTSNVQWAALEPLAAEILSGYEAERAVFVVADPKQSIFGWRGGEPRLLDELQRRYSLRRETLSGSRRSSSAVLDTVNRVFESLDGLEVLDGMEEAAAGWSTAFEAHEPVNDRPGYATVEVGPVETDPSERLPRALLDHVAQRAFDLHRRVPGAEIGVLTRTNEHATYLIASLKRLGAEASEEGGVPVTDSAPVLGLLALLRSIDRPSDHVARYMVARTPVGRIVGLGPDDWRRDRTARTLARSLRERLLSDGYGSTVSRWVRDLSPGLPDRDRRRLRQFAELAYRWDGRGSLRAGDFVRFVESSRVEDPATTAIRVMTIHRSKGLEFDAVFLPDLDASRLQDDSRRGFLPYRTNGTGPVRRVFPGVRGAERLLFPEIAEAEAQVREGSVRDGLSVLYVALTRARHAVHVFVAPDGGEGKRRGKSRNAGRLLCEALAPAQPREPLTRLFEIGDPDWWSKEAVRAVLDARPEPGPVGVAHPAPVRLAPTRGRRGLDRDTPSTLAHVGTRPFLAMGDEESPAARERGILVHRWLETIAWLEDGAPTSDDLLAIATELDVRHVDPGPLAQAFGRWIGAPGIRALLSRDSFPAGATAEREAPFLVRDGPRILEGRIDRLVAGGGRVVVVDWKTDVVDPESTGFEARVDAYRPQVDAYRRAAAGLVGCPVDRVEGVLAFLGAGVVRSWSGPA